MSNFGQIIIGPPGSGKTTYIKAMKTYYRNFKREVIVINLDPANELNEETPKDNNDDKTNVEKTFDIDIRELIKLEDVASSLKLGPNASFLYVFDFLYKNFDWLSNKMKIELKDKLNSSDDKEDNQSYYFLIDTPGQTEVFCLSESFKNIIKKLTDPNTFDVRLCCVSLIESNNIEDIPKYVFSVFSVLNSMIQLELPQINIITKIDLLKSLSSNKRPFPLSFYLQPQSEDLKNYLNQESNLVNNTQKNTKFNTLNRLISEFIGDYNLVSFTYLDVSNQKHLNKIACLVDKANGYYLEGHWSNKEETYLDERNHIAEIDINKELQDNDNNIDEEYDDFDYND